MPHVDCRCGRTLKLPSGFREGRVRCPGCNASYSIRTQRTKQDEQAASADVSNAERPRLDEHFDFDGRGASPPATGATIKCPGCGTTLKAHEVVCLKCGYHRVRGMRLPSPPRGSAASAGGSGRESSNGDDETPLSTVGCVEFDRAPERLRIKLRPTINLPLAIGLPIAVFILATLRVFAAGVAFAILGQLVMFAFVGGVAYWLAATLLNDRVLEVDRTGIRMCSEGRLPIFTFPNRVPAESIAQLYVAVWDRRGWLHRLIGSENYGGRYDDSYYQRFLVYVVTPSGWRRRLACLPTGSEALAVERAIEGYLGIEDIAVVAGWDVKLLGSENSLDDAEHAGRKIVVNDWGRLLAIASPLILIALIPAMPLLFAAFNAALGRPPAVAPARPKPGAVQPARGRPGDAAAQAAQKAAGEAARGVKAEDPDEIRRPPRQP